jgi:hypothetical protein
MSKNENKGAATVTVSKEQFDSLEASNQENRMIIEQLVGKIGTLEEAAMKGIGIDPLVARRDTLTSSVVQFTKTHVVGVQESMVKGGGNIVEAYTAHKGDVVILRDDEVTRLNKSFPGLVETDRSKFVVQYQHKAVPAFDHRGHPIMQRETTEIPVRDLVNAAPLVG